MRTQRKANSWYGGRALGAIGDLGCYSFHETKNYICGEGGALCINNEEMIQRAEIIRDKGTNRQRFLRGEVDKYTWVDVGSSYVPSELCSAFLCAQLEEMERISDRRREIYRHYLRALQPLEAEGLLRLPVIPDECDSNFHLFFVILPTSEQRDYVLAEMKKCGVCAIFHYVPLHNSPKGRELCGDVSLPVTESMSSRLIRLPFFNDMTHDEQALVIRAIKDAVRTAASSAN